MCSKRFDVESDASGWDEAFSFDLLGTGPFEPVESLRGLCTLLSDLELCTPALMSRRNFVMVTCMLGVSRFFGAMSFFSLSLRCTKSFITWRRIFLSSSRSGEPPQEVVGFEINSNSGTPPFSLSPINIRSVQHGSSGSRERWEKVGLNVNHATWTPSWEAVFLSAPHLSSHKAAGLLDLTKRERTRKKGGTRGQLTSWPASYQPLHLSTALSTCGNLSQQVGASRTHDSCFALGPLL